MERKMSKVVKMVAVLGLTLGVAACGSSEEEVVIVEPVTVDPVSSKF
jgi:hypothetical protein